MTTTGYRKGLVTDQPFQNSNSQTLMQYISTGIQASWVAYSNGWYYCNIAHTTNGPIQRPKVYKSRTGVEWLFIGSLGGDASWQDNGQACQMLVAPDGNVIIVSRYLTSAGEQNKQYRIGVWVINKDTQALTGPTLIYQGKGWFHDGMLYSTPYACFDTHGNLWIAHMEGVSKCDSYTGISVDTPKTYRPDESELPGRAWIWSHGNLAHELNESIWGDSGLYYNGVFSNVQLCPLPNGGIWLICKRWIWPGADYPMKSFVYTGAGWIQDREWLTVSDAGMIVTACANPSEDIIYLFYRRTYSVVNSHGYFGYRQSGNWTDVTSDWEADSKNYGKIDTLQRNVNAPRLRLHGKTLLLSVMTHQDAWHSGGCDIWGSQDKGACWYHVGHIGSAEEMAGYGSTRDVIKHFSLPHEFGEHETIYGVAANRYSVFFKDFGLKKARVKTDGKMYFTPAFRGQGPGRRTCFKGGKYWFFFQGLPDWAIKFITSEDGFTWTDPVDVQTMAAWHSIWADDQDEYVYVLYGQNDNVLRGRRIDMDSNLGPELDITSWSDRWGVGFCRDSLGNFWIAPSKKKPISNPNWAETGWTEHSYDGANVLEEAAEIVPLSNGDMVMIDAGWGNIADAWFYDESEGTWTKEADNLSWNSTDGFYGGVSAVVTPNDSVHIVTNFVGTPYYHRRVLGGAWTKNTQMTNLFVPEASPKYPIITYNSIDDELIVYAILGVSTLYRPITFTKSDDDGASWGDAEMHSLDTESKWRSTGTSHPENFAGLYVPYWSQENYLIKACCMTNLPAVKEGYTMMFFPRVQKYMKGGKFWKDGRKWDGISGYPEHY